MRADQNWPRGFGTLTGIRSSTFLARADPWNRAALLEVVAGYRRFGVAPEVALRLPKPAEDYRPFPVG